MGKFSYKEKNYSSTSSDATSITMFCHTWTRPHAFNWGWDSLDGNFEIHVTQKKRFAPDTILNMCIYTDCKITTLSNSITFFLVVRKKNWYHRSTRGEPSPFAPKWCLLFLPRLSFLPFAYDYSIFSTLFCLFSWFLYESDIWIIQLLQ